MSFQTNKDLKCLTFMKYNQLISSIPGNWKKIINDNKGKNISSNQKDDVHIKIRTKYKDIIHIKVKDIF